jgi:DNA-binding transcriptional ArsR family regulator
MLEKTQEKVKTTAQLTVAEAEEALKLTIVFKAVANKTRITVLHLLYKNGEMNVNDICRKVKCEQSLVSHHLSGMRNLGILKIRREGKNIYYSLNNLKLYESMLNVKDVHFATFKSMS